MAQQYSAFKPTVGAALALLSTRPSTPAFAHTPPDAGGVWQQSPPSSSNPPGKPTDIHCVMH